jgi:hypothetical protein
MFITVYLLSCQMKLIRRNKKVAINIVVSVIVSGTRQKMANYTVSYGLDIPVRGPFICLQATMMDTIALHFMCEIVGQLKREANAVARRINVFSDFDDRHRC